MYHSFVKNYLQFFAILFVSLVIIGIYRNYSPVPLWDMWNGYLDFYIQVQEGNWSEWLDQHNEHRIFLSRILFWIDIAIFGGKFYFLLFCHFILMSLIGLLFYKILSNLFEHNLSLTDKHALGYFVVIMTFSWIQKENITWGFQSQFFLAYLIPLYSFYLSARYYQTQSNTYFYAMLFLGVLSVFTMANGILTLPLLFILSFIFRFNTFKKIIMGIVTATVLFLNFIFFVSPPGHGSLSLTLLDHTRELFLYIFTYLGGPFQIIIESKSYLVPQIAGVLLIVSVLFFTYKALRTTWKHPMLFVLLAFLTYIGGTAFGTAGGRALFGIQQALESRYTTPTLMAWTALFLLYISYFKEKQKSLKLLSVIPVIIPLIFLQQQTESYNNKINEQIFNRDIASLALELGIEDGTYIRYVFPYADWAVRISKKPAIQNLSIFSNAKIKDVEQQIGTVTHSIPTEVLLGHLDDITTISDNTYRVSGWAFDNKQYTVPQTLFILDNKRTIIGYALTGMKRGDVKRAIDPNAKYSGFVGYIKKPLKYGETLYFVDKMSKKALKTFSNLTPYKLAPYRKDICQHHSSSPIILESTTYAINGTYERKNLPGCTIYGSFIKGDQDIATISIAMGESSCLIFKTGPTSTNQKISLTNGKQTIYEASLPLQRDWTILELDKEFLPANYTLRISDDGNGWGEWSALAFCGNIDHK